MRFTRSLIAASLLSFGSSAPIATAAYALAENCSGSSFLSCFVFFTAADPTHGFVRYLNQNDAQSQGLFSISGSTVTLGVDNKNKAPNGRASVRLQTKKLYNQGLFVLDLAHMPGSICGSWPSFWSWGSEKTWPENGEIDMIEGINSNTINAMSLHTSDGCAIDGAGSVGKVVTKNCFIGAAGQTSNAGCGIQSSSSASYGTPFNSGGGGVYAMEWTSSAIKMWFFLRNSIPPDLSGSSPDPSKWGAPQANFAGSCDFSKHFVNQQVVIDTTFCGDWAGALWGSDATCSKLGSCNDYVANNPAAFAESYWKINSFRVFRQ